MAEQTSIVSGFENVSTHRRESATNGGRPALFWYCAPDSWDTISKDESRREGKDGSWHVDSKGQLVIAPPAKKDFWRKTYYSPVLVKDDGPCLFAHLPLSKTATVETSFTLKPARQFDQAGLCIRIDNEHWLKAGIEVVDGKPRLSCVVTNIYSDWSTQPWSGDSPSAKVRIHILQNGSFVVEAARVDSPKSWEFIRIAHLSQGMRCEDDTLLDHPRVLAAWAGDSAPRGYLYAGVFACCPEDQDGCTATFHSFSIVEGSTFKHDADGNHE